MSVPSADIAPVTSQPGKRVRTTPVRVVYCLDSFLAGGTELNALRTAERLDPSRVALSLVTLQRDGPLRDQWERLGVPMHATPLTSLYSPGTVARMFSLAGHLRASGAQIVHAHDQYDNVFAVCAARIARVPAVIASRRWGRVRTMVGRANRYTYRLADRVLANSAAVARFVEDDGIATNRIVVVPNFVEEAAFRRSDAIDTERMRLGVPSGSRVIGCVANLSPVKNHALLLRAFARVAGGDVPPTLVLYGQGSEEPSLRALAQQLGVADRVRFAGFLRGHNLHFLFDVSVLTSRSEGFPNTLVEAMAAGRACVATDVGGVRDAVEHGVTGTLVASDDEQALASALSGMLADDATRARMGAAGLQHARTRFHEDVVIEQVTQLYESLVAGAVR